LVNGTFELEPVDGIDGGTAAEAVRQAKRCDWEMDYARAFQWYLRAVYRMNRSNQFVCAANCLGDCVRVLAIAGTLCYKNGEVRESIQWHQRCALLHQELGNVILSEHAWFKVTNGWEQLGEYANAVVSAQRTVDIQRKQARLNPGLQSIREASISCCRLSCFAVKAAGEAITIEKAYEYSALSAEYAEVSAELDKQKATLLKEGGVLENDPAYFGTMEHVIKNLSIAVMDYIRAKKYEEAVRCGKELISLSKRCGEVCDKDQVAGEAGQTVLYFAIDLCRVAEACIITGENDQAIAYIREAIEIDQDSLKKLGAQSSEEERDEVQFHVCKDTVLLAHALFNKGQIEEALRFAREGFEGIKCLVENTRPSGFHKAEVFFECAVAYSIIQQCCNGSFDVINRADCHFFYDAIEKSHFAYGRDAFVDALTIALRGIEVGRGLVACVEGSGVKILVFEIKRHYSKLVSIAGNCNYSLGIHAAAGMFLQEAAQISQEIGQEASAAKSYSMAANSFLLVLCPEEAVDCIDRSIELERKLGDKDTLIKSLAHAGKAAYEAAIASDSPSRGKDFAQKALSYLDERIELQKDCSNESHKAAALARKSNCLAYLGKYRKAAACSREVAAINEGMSNAVGAALAFLYAATYSKAAHDHKKMRGYMSEVRVIIQDLLAQAPGYIRQGNDYGKVERYMQKHYPSLFAKEIEVILAEVLSDIVHKGSCADEDRKSSQAIAGAAILSFIVALNILSIAAALVVLVTKRYRLRTVPYARRLSRFRKGFARISFADQDRENTYVHKRFVALKKRMKSPPLQADCLIDQLIDIACFDCHYCLDALSLIVDAWFHWEQTKAHQRLFSNGITRVMSNAHCRVDAKWAKRHLSKRYLTLAGTIKEDAYDALIIPISQYQPQCINVAVFRQITGILKGHSAMADFLFYCLITSHIDVRVRREAFGLLGLNTYSSLLDKAQARIFAADQRWKQFLKARERADEQSRKVVIFEPQESMREYMGSAAKAFQSLAHKIKRLIDEGFFVVLKLYGNNFYGFDEPQRVRRHFVSHYLDEAEQGCVALMAVRDEPFVALFSQLADYYLAGDDKGEITNDMVRITAQTVFGYERFIKGLNDEPVTVEIECDEVAMIKRDRDIYELGSLNTPAPTVIISREALVSVTFHLKPWC